MTGIVREAEVSGERYAACLATDSHSGLRHDLGPSSSRSIDRRPTPSDLGRAHRSRLLFLLIEYFPNFSRQREGRKGLLEKGDLREEDAVPDHRVIGVTAHI